MSRHPDSRLNATALLSLLVGIFGTLCFFWGIAGVAAVVLGAVAYREIKRSEGREHGAGLAISGIVLGVVHLVALVVGVGLLVVLQSSLFGGKRTLGGSATWAPRAAPAPLPKPVPVPPSPPATEDTAATATRETATRIAHFAGVTLVDPGPNAGRLGAVLANERQRAAQAEQKLLVWLSAPDCTSCTGVSIALTDRRLQTALDGVRLLRIDARDYRVELAARGLDPNVLPGFALLGSHDEPIDYVNGGEWDEDIAKNIAPVLRKFVQGTYKTRRNAWTGVPHAGDALL